VFWSFLRRQESSVVPDWIPAEFILAEAGTGMIILKNLTLS